MLCGSQSKHRTLKPSKLPQVTDAAFITVHQSSLLPHQFSAYCSELATSLKSTISHSTNRWHSWAGRSLCNPLGSGSQLWIPSHPAPLHCWDCVSRSLNCASLCCERKRCYKGTSHTAPVGQNRSTELLLCFLTMLKLQQSRFPLPLRLAAAS